LEEVLTKTKKYKTNITGYLAIEVIDRLEQLAKVKNVSRNCLFEEAILDFLNREEKREVA
jgi:predicted transcriptional regulator